MSRLDSFIRRMMAQRDCLDYAAGAIADMPGPVLEIGLGNGRTFDHLRGRLPEREIFVFDRQINAHPACIPDSEHMLLGEVEVQLPQLTARLGPVAALAHVDIGSGDAAANKALAARLSPLVDAAMRKGGIILCDQDLAMANWTPLPLPPGVAPGRYNIMRKD
ncbi:class I SAM-dependent methyltransferase [Radicibacter daui]|uniref:class I SAM-dependent methyltransferase n=1 Tax=Radicibacter daui TaxID=3064829 RepID=UPI004046F0FC